MSKPEYLKKLNLILSNPMCMPIILTIGFVGWICNIDFITIPLLCLYTGLLLIFCDDIKNIFAVALSAQFFINTLECFADYVAIGIGLLFFVIGLIVYLVKELLIRKISCHKGKMFWPFVCALIAYLIGGIWGYFNLLNALIITAMTSATYFLYWAAINFTHNLKQYLRYFFIAMGIILCIQVTISYARVDEPFKVAILAKNVIYIGLQNINTVALYFVLAMLSILQFAPKHKLDWLFTLASTFFAGCVYFTYCRICLFVCAIVFLIFLIYIFTKSKNKPIFLFIAIIGIFVIEIVCLFKWDKIYKFIQYYINKGFNSNGREELWSWCLEKFLQNPVFGVGFTSVEPVPSIASYNIVLAHNTLLQYLTSCGIVGSIIISYYYFSRWQIALTKYNEFKFVNSISLFAIALVSLIDQEPTMDVFVIVVITLLVALAELDTEETLINGGTNTEDKISNEDQNPTVKIASNTLEKSNHLDTHTEESSNAMECATNSNARPKDKHLTRGKYKKNKNK